MASIHRQKGKPHWFVAFYDPEGFRRFRTTATDNAKVARTISVAIERASILARKNSLSNEKALKLVRDTCTAIAETHGQLASDQAQAVLTAHVEEFIKIAGGELSTYTVKTWLRTWLDGRTDASKATIAVYKGVIDLFLRHLGARADRPLSMLQPKTIEDFKVAWAEKVSAHTVNRAIKCLKASFNNAVAKRQLDFNPAEHVQYIDVAESGRRPFAMEEIRSILAHTPTEWKTMVLLGYYTGLRLRDCANLTWRNVQLHTGEIQVATQKTGRKQVLPIAEPLQKHLESIAGDNPDAPLCPGLAGRNASTLSAEFREIMVKAGIVADRDHQGTGKGRDGKRDTAHVSFHSLRYNTTSALKSAGVSDSITMDIVGHETASVSRNYTKIDDSAKRAAVAKMPDITA